MSVVDSGLAATIFPDFERQQNCRIEVISVGTGQAFVAVNPAAHPGVNAMLAERFAAWLRSPDIQRRIGQSGASEFGQPLFYPSAR